MTFKDSQGSSALHWACLQLDHLSLEKLCGNIFDTDLFDDRGHTPLYLACIGGRDAGGNVDYIALQKCMASLIALGADVNFADSLGHRLIQYATSKWQPLVVETLLRAGAESSSVQTSTGNTLLHLLLQSSPLESNVYFNRSCLAYAADNPDLGSTVPADVETGLRIQTSYTISILKLVNIE